MRGALDAAARRAADGVVRARARASSRTRSAGRSRRAAAGASPPRSRPRPGPSASRSRPATGSTSLAELPPARAVLLDLTPRQVLAIAGDRLPDRLPAPARGASATGPGVFKVDWALDGPIPWTRPGDRAGRHRARRRARWARSPRAEAAVARGRVPDRPFVLLVQPTLADPSRAPEGKHVAWAYCHVPNGSTGRRDRGDRGPGRALRARVPRPDPRPRREGRARRWRPTTPTTSAATSTAASTTGVSCSSGRSSAGTRTRRRIRRSSCARRRRRRAAGSTACAARTRPAAPDAATLTHLRRPGVTRRPVAAIVAGCCSYTGLVLADAGGGRSACLTAHRSAAIRLEHQARQLRRPERPCCSS